MSEIGLSVLPPRDVVEKTPESEHIPEQLKELFAKGNEISKAELTEEQLQSLAERKGIAPSALEVGQKHVEADRLLTEHFKTAFTEDPELRSAMITYAETQSNNEDDDKFKMTYVQGAGRFVALMLDDTVSKQAATADTAMAQGITVTGPSSVDKLINHAPVIDTSTQTGGVVEPSLKPEATTIPEPTPDQIKAAHKLALVGRRRAQVRPGGVKASRSYETYMDSLPGSAKQTADDEARKNKAFDASVAALRNLHSAQTTAAENVARGEASPDSVSQTPAITSIDITPANDAPKITGEEYTKRLNKDYIPDDPHAPKLQTYTEYMDELFKPLGSDLEEEERKGREYDASVAAMRNQHAAQTSDAERQSRGEAVPTGVKAQTEKLKQRFPRLFNRGQVAAAAVVAAGVLIGNAEPVLAPGLPQDEKDTGHTPIALVTSAEPSEPVIPAAVSPDTTPVVTPLESLAGLGTPSIIPEGSSYSQELKTVLDVELPEFNNDVFAETPVGDLASLTLLSHEAIAESQMKMHGETVSLKDIEAVVTKAEDASDPEHDASIATLKKWMNEMAAGVAVRLYTPDDLEKITPIIHAAEQQGAEALEETLAVLTGKKTLQTTGEGDQYTVDNAVPLPTLPTPANTGEETQVKKTGGFFSKLFG